MTDFALQPGPYGIDLVIDANDLFADDGLRTAVLLSLFTDRRALSTDELPGGGDDRKGWWGDAVPVNEAPDGRLDLIGSRLWLLAREKRVPSVLARARQYATEALAWLIQDKVVRAVDIAASFQGLDQIRLEIALTRPNSEMVRFQFNLTWAAEAARVVAA